MKNINKTMSLIIFILLLIIPSAFGNILISGTDEGPIEYNDQGEIIWKPAWYKPFTLDSTTDNYKVQRLANGNNLYYDNPIFKEVDRSGKIIWQKDMRQYPDNTGYRDILDFHKATDGSLYVGTYGNPIPPKFYKIQNNNLVEIWDGTNQVSRISVITESPEGYILFAGDAKVYMLDSGSVRLIKDYGGSINSLSQAGINDIVGLGSFTYAVLVDKLMSASTQERRCFIDIINSVGTILKSIDLRATCNFPSSISKDSVGNIIWADTGPRDQRGFSKKIMTVNLNDATKSPLMEVDTTSLFYDIMDYFIYPFSIGFVGNGYTQSQPTLGNPVFNPKDGNIAYPSSLLECSASTTGSFNPFIEYRYKKQSPGGPWNIEFKELLAEGRDLDRTASVTWRRSGILDCKERSCQPGDKVICEVRARDTGGGYNGHKTSSEIIIQNPLDNGQLCSSDMECKSTHCKLDFDGTGKFCANSDDCVHDGTIIADGASVCLGMNRRACAGGIWSEQETCTYGCSNGVCNSCSDGAICGVHQLCQGDTCSSTCESNFYNCDNQPGCESESPCCTPSCNTFGAKECVGSLLKTCAGTCLQWTAAQSCGVDKTCKNGNCICDDSRIDREVCGTKTCGTVTDKCNTQRTCGEPCDPCLGQNDGPFTGGSYCCGQKQIAGIPQCNTALCQKDELICNGQNLDCAKANAGTACTTSSQVPGECSDTASCNPKPETDCNDGKDNDKDGTCDFEGCICTLINNYCGTGDSTKTSMAGDSDCTSCTQCNDCGGSIFDFDLCETNECSACGNCFFKESLLLRTTGSCNACVDATCESYDVAGCALNSCNLEKCKVVNNKCCTDKNNDGVCDSEANTFILKRVCDSLQEEKWLGYHKDIDVGSTFLGTVKQYFTCVNNDNDRAPCKPGSCVYNGVCYDPNEIIDIDNDAIKEKCQPCEECGLPVYANSVCVDADSGVDKSVKARCVDDKDTYIDSCEGGQLVDYSCENSACTKKVVSCGDGYFCNDGRCDCEDTDKTDAQICAGKTCGTVLDSCGKTRNCGTCDPGTICVDGGCKCTDLRLNNEVCGSAVCGDVLDACDTPRTCGRCELGFRCNSGACVTDGLPLALSSCSVSCTDDDGCTCPLGCVTSFDIRKGQTCSNRKCTGNLPQNAFLGPASYTDDNSAHLWVYSDGATSDTPCKWKCTTGSRDGNGCE